MTRELPDVPGVRHRYVEANGLTFHVAEAGPADAPGDPVLMLHGWPQHWYEWRGLIPHFADGRRVLCPDLRGLGWSDAPPHGYDKETLAADVVALLDVLGIERVDLIGHDWGGWAGFLLCLGHPERVRRYVALNIAHPWPRVTPRATASMWRFWYMAMFATPVLGWRAARSLGRRAAEGRLPPGGRIPGWDDRDHEVFLSQFAEPARARATTQIYRSFLVRDLPRALGGRYRRRRLSTPTLLLYGVEDPVVRPHILEGWEPHADDMRVEHVPGVGHFIADEVPELVARRALAHFSESADTDKSPQAAHFGPPAR